jgi:hypothetical protein
MAFFVTAVVAAVDLGTVAAIATAVSEVGTALSVVGAVTGNSTLEKVGGVMGLAGGVVELADGAFDGATTVAASDGTPAITDSNAAMTAQSQTATTAGDQLPVTGSSVSPTIDPSTSLATSTGIDPDTGINWQPNSDLANADPANGLVTGNYASAPGTTPLTADQAAVEEAQGNQNLAALNSSSAPGLTGAPGASASVDGATAGSSAYQASGANSTDYNNIAQPSTGTGASPIAPSTPSTSAAGGVTPPPGITSGAAGTINSAIGGNSAAQLGMQSNAAIGGENAALTAPGTLIAGGPATSAVMPADGMGTPNLTASNDILDTSSAQSGTSYGTGSGINGAVANPATQTGTFQGIENWVNANPHLANGLMQLGGGIASGMGKAYEANRQYQLGLGQLTINQQKQANANSQVTSGGIINTARKNSAGS